MYIIRRRLCNVCGIRILSRLIYTHTQLWNKALVSKETGFDGSLPELIKKYQKKIIYNSFIDKEYPQLSCTKNFFVLKHLGRVEREHLRELASLEPLPVALQYLPGYSNVKNNDNVSKIAAVEDHSVIHFPYSKQNSFSVNRDIVKQPLTGIEENIAEVSEREVQTRHEILKHVSSKGWMTEYDNYDENDCATENIGQSNINYGTPDAKFKISNVPCGGCGALLHCKDSSIPGYIPSEIYRNCFRKEGDNLHSLICQRCHFLKNYNIALQVRVAPEDYRKVLETIQDKFALIILVVDLLDFPSSIWPGIADVVGYKKPIVVVGNKVDLLPRDSRGYLDRIKKLLKESVMETVSHKSSANIKHVGLISAKTGWGVEELINKLHNLWQYRGDVYVVGSTNVGKSTLFNCLLQSDYCKVKAVDLVQRATTSVWPGTTMNLLKFPILRPSGWRLYVRTKRLKSLQQITELEDKLNKIQLSASKDPKFATLIGRMDRTFSTKDEEIEEEDPFSVSGSANSDGRIRLGVDENHADYIASKWCYDTPGVVLESQIIHLLTTEELMLTLPRELIQPRTFNVREGQSLLIAGIGRVDYIKGPPTIKLTVFCANPLPITMCYTEEAGLLYDEFLGTEVLQVPKGTHDRLKHWPALKMVGPLKLIGNYDYSSCGDIVLSNAGWVAVQCNPDSEVAFNAWTPEGRGIYCRNSLLPYTIKVRGTKVKGSPLHIHDKVYIPK